MGALGSEVTASLAQGVALLSEGKSATSLSSLGSELVNLVDALLFGDSADSHHAGLSARDHLVGADLGIVAAVVLGFAHSGALVRVGDLELLSGTGGVSTSSLVPGLGETLSVVSSAPHEFVTRATPDLGIASVHFLVFSVNGALGGLGDSSVTTSVTLSLSSDFTTTPSISAVVASAGVVVLLLGV